MHRIINDMLWRLLNSHTYYIYIVCAPKARVSSIVSLPQVGLAVIDLRTMHLQLMQLVETSRTYTNTM